VWHQKPAWKNCSTLAKIIRMGIINSLVDEMLSLAIFGGSSSGRTADSDSAYRGSNPRPPATLNNLAFDWKFLACAKILVVIGGK
jgi:hypothetical protein